MLEHRLAFATALAAIPVMLAGGAVSSTGSSQASPAIATAAGLMQIALTVLLWRRRPGRTTGRVARAGAAQ